MQPGFLSISAWRSIGLGSSGVQFRVKAVRSAILSVLVLVPSLGAASAVKTIAPGIVQVGTIQDPNIKESSGIVASRKHPGVFWTHNDGKKERLYAIDRAGKTLGDFKIDGAKVEDWEDIALDSENRLYLADTGNNNADRAQVAVYRILEPDPKGATKGIPVDAAWRLSFPGRPFDAEALVIQGDSGYIISKVTNDRRAELYRFALAEAKGVVTLSLVGGLRIDSPVTAADTSPDGRRLAVLAKNGVYLFQVDGDVSKATQLESRIKRFKHDSAEACAFFPEGLLVTAESREIYLFSDEIFRPEK